MRSNRCDPPPWCPTSTRGRRASAQGLASSIAPCATRPRARRAPVSGEASHAFHERRPSAPATKAAVERESVVSQPATRASACARVMGCRQACSATRVGRELGRQLHLAARDPVERLEPARRSIHCGPRAASACRGGPGVPARAPAPSCSASVNSCSARVGRTISSLKWRPAPAAHRWWRDRPADGCPRARPGGAAPRRERVGGGATRSPAQGATVGGRRRGAQSATATTPQPNGDRVAREMVKTIIWNDPGVAGASRRRTAGRPGSA
jgi:hypothetical protein